METSQWGNFWKTVELLCKIDHPCLAGILDVYIEKKRREKGGWKEEGNDEEVGGRGGGQREGGGGRREGDGGIGREGGGRKEGGWRREGEGGRREGGGERREGEGMEEGVYVVYRGGWERGRSLYDLVSEEGCLSEEEGKRIVKDLLLGIEELHYRGVLIGGLKGENVWIKEDGSALLINLSRLRLKKQKKHKKKRKEKEERGKMEEAGRREEEEGRKAGGGRKEEEEKLRKEEESDEKGGRREKAGEDEEGRREGGERMEEERIDRSVYKKEEGIESSAGVLEEGIDRSILSSPEVMFGSYDEKSDIWAVGVLYYFMLFGEFPFPDEFFMETGEKSPKKLKKHFKRVLKMFFPAERQGVSAEALAFLGKVLSTKKKARLTGGGALREGYLGGRRRGGAGGRGEEEGEREGGGRRVERRGTKPEEGGGREKGEIGCEGVWMEEEGGKKEEGGGAISLLTDFLVGFVIQGGRIEEKRIMREKEEDEGREEEGGGSEEESGLREEEGGEREEEGVRKEEESGWREVGWREEEQLFKTYQTICIATPTKQDRKAWIDWRTGLFYRKIGDNQWIKKGLKNLWRGVCGRGMTELFGEKKIGGGGWKEVEEEGRKEVLLTMESEKEEYLA